MEPVAGAPAQDNVMPRDSWKADSPEPARGDAEVQDLRAQLERFRQREDQIMNLIGCKNPEKLMHDLRNVLNELQLLRMLAETDKP